MKLEEFIAKQKDAPKEYCPCIIDVRGNVYDCPKGHLEALLALDQNQETLADIPDNMAPLFYMIAKTGAVVVDYENQVYNETLTEQQKNSLSALHQQGLISMELKNIHGNINL